MGQALRLRVIDGGLEARVAIASAPELPPQTFPDRIPLPRARFEGMRMLAGVTIALAVHAGILAYAMQYAGDEEARAEGGADSVAVIEGISIITMDSIDSAFSDGVDSLREAVAAPDAPTTATVPEDVAVASAEAVAAESVPTAAAEAVDDVTAETAPEALTAAVPDEAAAAPVSTQTAVAEPVEEAAAVVDEITAPMASDDSVALATETDAAVAASGEIVAAESDVAAAAPINDAEAAALPTDTDAPANDAEDPSPTLTDAPTQPVDDTIVTAAVSDTPDATVPAETIVAAQDVTPPPEVKPEPTPLPKPKPPRQAKPAPKPAPKPAEQAPARRSQESTASVAEQAARGPKPGTAGAGGSSNTERGKASVSNYQSKLSAHLRRHRVYPAAARSQGLRGTAVVSFTVNASGAVTRVSLAKSSGHAILDEAALQMVRRASPFPPIPPALGAKSMPVNAPVRFDGR